MIMKKKSQQPTNRYTKALNKRIGRISTFVKWVEAINEDTGRTDDEVINLLVFHFDYLINNLIKESEEIL